MAPPSALVTFNLVLCLVEAASKGGGSALGEVDLSAVAIAEGGHKKEAEVKFSLEEHEHGHAGEAEDETNDDRVAFVEVTASGELKTTAPPRPRKSAFVQVSDFNEKRGMEKNNENKTDQEKFIHRVSHEQTRAGILEWESSTKNATNKAAEATAVPDAAAAAKDAGSESQVRDGGGGHSESSVHVAVAVMGSVFIMFLLVYSVLTPVHDLRWLSYFSIGTAISILSALLLYDVVKKMHNYHFGVKPISKLSLVRVTAMGAPPYIVLMYVLLFLLYIWGRRNLEAATAAAEQGRELLYSRSVSYFSSFQLEQGRELWEARIFRSASLIAHFAAFGIIDDNFSPLLKISFLRNDTVVGLCMPFIFFVYFLLVTEVIRIVRQILLGKSNFLEHLIRHAENEAIALTMGSLNAPIVAKIGQMITSRSTDIDEASVQLALTSRDKFDEYKFGSADSYVRICSLSVALFLFFLLAVWVEPDAHVHVHDNREDHNVAETDGSNGVEQGSVLGISWHRVIDLLHETSLFSSAWCGVKLIQALELTGRKRLVWSAAYADIIGAILATVGLLGPLHIIVEISVRCIARDGKKRTDSRTYAQIGKVLGSLIGFSWEFAFHATLHLITVRSVLFEILGEFIFALIPLPLYLWHINDQLYLLE